MNKIQFLKIVTEYECCHNNGDGDAHIVKWCIMNINEFWTLIYKELALDKYISKYVPRESYEMLQNEILRRGRVSSDGCNDCKTIYLFQSPEEELLNNFHINGRKIKTIEEITQSLNNKLESCEMYFEYVVKNYKLPSWFNFTENSDDYEWLCENIMKNGKHIKRPTKSIIMRKEENETIETDKYIYSNELVDKYFALLNFFCYINDTEIDGDITDNIIDKILSIKINDFDWYYKWMIPKNEINSDMLLFQKITDDNNESSYDSSDSSVSSD
jgi:hypothetical protein